MALLMQEIVDKIFQCIRLEQQIIQRRKKIYGLIVSQEARDVEDFIKIDTKPLAACVAREKEFIRILSENENSIRRYIAIVSRDVQDLQNNKAAKPILKEIAPLIKTAEASLDLLYQKILPATEKRIAQEEEFIETPTPESLNQIFQLRKEEKKLRTKVVKDLTDQLSVMQNFEKKAKKWVNIGITIAAPLGATAAALLWQFLYVKSGGGSDEGILGTTFLGGMFLPFSLLASSALAMRVVDQVKKRVLKEGLREF